MKKNREIMILAKLIRDGSCTIRQLALLCDASYKTIQSDIKNINQKMRLNGFACEIASQSGVGVVLTNSVNEDMDKVLFLLQNTEYTGGEYDKDHDALQIAFWLL